MAACELNPAAEMFNQQFQTVLEAVLIFKSENVSMKIWTSQKSEELVTLVWHYGMATSSWPLPFGGGSGTLVRYGFPRPS